MRLSYSIISLPDSATDLYTDDAADTHADYTLESIGSYTSDGTGATDTPPGDDGTPGGGTPPGNTDGVEVGPPGSEIDVDVKPPGENCPNGCVCFTPPGEPEVCFPIPEGADPNKPWFVYVQDGVITIVWGGITVVTYKIPDSIWNSWNVSTIQISFVTGGVATPAPPANIIPIPEAGYTYSLSFEKLKGPGWWNKYRNHTSWLRQPDVFILNDDSVKVSYTVSQEDLANAKKHYAGGTSDVVDLEDVVLLYAAGYVKYLKVGV